MGRERQIAAADIAEPEIVASAIPAATVVIFRHAPAGSPPQLLMLERSRAMRFAGGATVFPGGRVDEADRVLAAETWPAMDSADTAARIAAIRETLEEAGLVIGIEQPVSAEDARRARALLLEQGRLATVLEQFGWSLAPETLIPFARWCPNWEHCFDTRFYLHDLGSGAVEVTVDQTENSHLFWASASEALAMADRGEISVIYPTRRNLERLALFASFAEARAQAEAIPVRTIIPAEAERDGTPSLTIPEDRGYPVTFEPIDTAARGRP